MEKSLELQFLESAEKGYISLVKHAAGGVGWEQFPSLFCGAETMLIWLRPDPGYEGATALYREMDALNKRYRSQMEVASAALQDLGFRPGWEKLK